MHYNNITMVKTGKLTQVSKTMIGEFIKAKNSRVRLGVRDQSQCDNVQNEFLEGLAYYQESHWNFTKQSFINNVTKIFQKNSIFHPLICVRVCIKGIKNVSFSEQFANVLNE